MQRIGRSVTIAAPRGSFVQRAFQPQTRRIHSGASQGGVTRSCTALRVPGVGSSTTLLFQRVGSATRVSCFSTTRALRKESNPSNLPGAFNQVQGWKPSDDKDGGQSGEGGGDGFNTAPEPGYLPFPPPFHTINIISLLLIGNFLIYFIMWLGTDDHRDFVVEHFTLSHENANRIYPFFTNAFYQEHIFQLLFDSWLLTQFGRSTFSFLGGTRLLAFWAMCQVGSGLILVGRQHMQLYTGMDEIEVRGRCYGSNPFILGLVGVEGLVFRNLNMLQNPPVPFLVMTAGVMVLDVWRIMTTRPEEHAPSTGGALIAYLFWSLPTRRMGLDKLTAKL